MKPIKHLILGVLAAFVSANTITAKEVESWVLDRYAPLKHRDMAYRLLRPVELIPGNSYPVIVSLHGAGGTGTDNIKNLRKWNQFYAEETNLKEYPCYVVAPQTTKQWSASDLSKIKEIIAALTSVDMNRIYIMGHSMGGHGTYIMTQLDPAYFAAAASSAGSGLKRTPRFVDVEKIKDVPFWIFHGDEDPKCPIEFNQKIFTEMTRIGGNMKFTTWKGDKHGGNIALKMVTGAKNGTTQMSGDRCDPELVFMKWLFSQKRTLASPAPESNTPDGGS